MDTITHIVLGACLGEVCIGRQLGKKAMIIGAVANSLPDIDIIAASWLRADENILAHRGITHSVIFVVFMSFLLAEIFRRWYIAYSIPLKRWLIFFGAEMGAHIFIDAFNAYGTGWFEPFSHYRISFNIIFVADPLFSLWPGISFLVLLILKRHHRLKKHWVAFGLGMSSLYLLFCCFNKWRVDSDVRKMIANERAGYTTYFTTPTPFNNFLWYVVAGNDSGFYTGYYTVLDRHKPLALEYYPRNDSLLHSMQGDDELQHLVRFSQGFYTVEQWQDTLVFNDLRFGQIVGWQRPHAKFVFHYFLQRPGANALVLQRGRFEDWDWNATKALWNRIKGR